MSRPPTGNRERFGFRDGDKGTHSSRTLMLTELSAVLSSVPPESGMTEYRRAVVEENVLGKRTVTTREHTVRKLKALYGFDPTIPVYRILRRLWDEAPEGRPLLALLCAVARDPLLRGSVDVVLEAAEGAPITPDMLAATVQRPLAATTRISTGQNLASSWAQAGFVAGVMTKTRARATATPGAAAYALALGFMEGHRGSLLLTTPWTRLLDRPADDVLALVRAAARRGLVEYRAAGDVMDLRVDALLTNEERGWCDGQPG